MHVPNKFIIVLPLFLLHDDLWTFLLIFNLPFRFIVCTRAIGPVSISSVFFLKDSIFSLICNLLIFMKSSTHMDRQAFTSRINFFYIM
jgi:hypothetical protein